MNTEPKYNYDLFSMASLIILSILLIIGLWLLIDGRKINNQTIISTRVSPTNTVNQTPSPKP